MIRLGYDTVQLTQPGKLDLKPAMAVAVAMAALVAAVAAVDYTSHSAITCADFQIVSVTSDYGGGDST